MWLRALFIHTMQRLAIPCNALPASFRAFQDRDEELHKRDYINARKDKTLVALHGNAFIANQEQLKGHIFTKVCIYVGQAYVDEYIYGATRNGWY